MAIYQRCILRLLAIGAVSAMLLVALLGRISAEEAAVEPADGSLVLVVTDLLVPAGAVNLAVVRTLAPGDGLVGTHWRLDWDSRLARSGTGLILRDGAEQIEFLPEGGAFRAAGGDRLVATADGGFVRTRGGLLRDRYDAEGRLVTRDLGAGQQASLRYDAEGRLARVDGPLGSFLAFGLDAGRVARIETSDGDAAAYGYAGQELVSVATTTDPPVRYGYAGGRLVRIEDPSTGALEIGYDGNGRVTGRRWADGTTERWEYDDAARRTRRIAVDGGITSWAGSADGRVLEETGPNGQRVLTELDSRGRVVAVTEPDGSTGRIAYDVLDRVIEVRGADGRAAQIRYVEDSRLVAAVTSADGTRQEFDYDPNGNLLSVMLDGETVVRFTYTSAGQIESVVSAGAAERRYQYDSAGRLAAQIDELGRATRYEHDARGNLSRETDPLGGTFSYAYDDRGRLIAETGPTGRTTQFEHDAAGRLVAETGPDGRVTRYEHDARGRRVAIVDPAGRRHAEQIEQDRSVRWTRHPDGTLDRTRYDTAGRVVEQTDPLGRTVRNEYDADGRLAAEHLPTGQTIRHRYNPAMRLAETIDGVGGLLVYGWDELGMLRSITDSTGAAIEFDYDEAGRIAVVADPYGRERHQTHNARGRLAEVTSASGDTARYAYDHEGRIVAVQHPDSTSTVFERDAIGNIVAVQDQRGRQVRHDYDLAGERVATTDAAGRTTRFAYDAAGRLAQQQLGTGRAITYRYGALDEVLEVDDKTFPIQYRRDAQGRVLAVTYPAIGKSVAYEYDGFGLRTRMTGSSGLQLHYRYDQLRRLAAIRLPDDGEILLGYDVAGRLSTVTYPNGVRGEWQYDPVGAVARLRYADESGRDLAAWDYARDLIGNATAVTRSHAPALRFGYDEDNRLVSEQSASGWTASYAYHPGGDRARRAARGETVDYRYVDGELAEAGPERLTHDVHGNMIRRSGPRGETIYEYDEEGRLARATPPSGERVSFGYTASGERAWRRDAAGLTYFVHDGVELLEELDESGAATALYVHGPGIDWPLAMLREGQTYFYHADAQGNVALLTDRQGRVAAAYETDAYGNLLSELPALRNPFVFAGREHEPALGLYYNRARYYDPALGRFLSADPQFGGIGDPARLNRYAYALNAPTRYRDPMGLAVDSTPPGWNPGSNYTIDYDFYKAKGVSPAILRQLERDVMRNIMQDPNYLVNKGKPLTALEARSAARYLVEKAANPVVNSTGSNPSQHVERIANRLAKPQSGLPREWITSPDQRRVSFAGSRAPSPSPIPSQTGHLKGIHGDYLYQPGQRPINVADVLAERAKLGLDPPRPPTGAAPPSGAPSSGSSAALPSSPPSGTPSTGTPPPSGTVGSNTQAVPRPTALPPSTTQAIPRPGAPGAAVVPPGPRLIPLPDSPGQYLDRRTGSVVGDNRPTPDKLGRIPPKPPAAPPPGAAPGGTPPGGTGGAPQGPANTGETTTTKPSGPTVKGVVGSILGGAIIGAVISSADCALAGRKDCGDAAVGGAVGGAVVSAVIGTAVEGAKAGANLVATRAAPYLPGLATNFPRVAAIAGRLAAVGPWVAPAVAVVTTGYTSYRLGRTLGTRLRWGTPQQKAISGNMLSQADNFYVSLLESTTADAAEVRRLLAEAQGLKADLQAQLGRTGKGGVSSTTIAEEQQRRVAMLRDRCIEAAGAIEAMNTIATGAMTTARNVASLLDAAEEPPNSTIPMGNARQQMKQLESLGPRMQEAATRLPTAVKAVQALAKELGTSADGKAMPTRAELQARIAAYDGLTRQLQEAANALRAKASNLHDLKEQYIGQLDSLRVQVRSADEARFQTIAARIASIDVSFPDLLGDGTSKGSVYDEVSTSDATVKRFTDELESAFQKSEGTDIACGPFTGPDALAEAVKTATANVSDLSDLVFNMAGAFKLRTERLKKITESDRAILQGAPALIKKFEESGQQDKVQETQKLVERVNERQKAMPKEQAAVEDAGKSASEVHKSTAHTMTLMGIGGN